jgi:hypothetical protein
LWQQLVENYDCRNGYPVRCGLTSPAWMKLREVSVMRRSHWGIDWSRWSFGLPPPPFLFGVESYEPDDAAERERGHELAERALSWLGVDEPSSVPAAVKLEASGWSDTPDGRMAWSATLHVDVDSGRLLLDAQRGEGPFVVGYASGEGGWRNRGERREPLEPNLHHGLERLLRSATTAQWLAPALAEPDRTKLRALGGTEVEGEPCERFLVTLDDRFVAELCIAEEGRVISERGWRRTEHGMDMVTTVHDAWSTYDGIEVATKSHDRRDGADGVSSETELDALEWGAAVPAAEDAAADDAPARDI